MTQRCFNIYKKYCPKFKGFDEYVAELRELFDEYADEGIIAMPNKTVVYWGTIKE